MSHALPVLEGFIMHKLLIVFTALLENCGYVQRNRSSVPFATIATTSQGRSENAGGDSTVDQSAANVRRDSGLRHRVLVHPEGSSFVAEAKLGQPTKHNRTRSFIIAHSVPVHHSSMRSES